MPAAETRDAPAEPFLLAGQPLANWAFALRIWLAMMVALYSAFWLQLDSASSSAVTVAILAQPRRGQAFNKAFFRICATFIGFVASIVITAVFTQSRDLFIVAFAAWMAIAVYVASCYDGTRAYCAVLSGYTVAIIAVSQIDSPQNVFVAGMARVAVVSLGIASVGLINDVLAAPDVYSAILPRLLKAGDATSDLIQSLVRGEDPGPDRTVAVLGQIVGTRLDVLTLGSESPLGARRREAAKSAAAALVGSISAARSYALMTANLPPQERSPDALTDGEETLIAAALVAEMAKSYPSSNRIMILDCALHLAERRQLAEDELRALERSASPRRKVSLPVHRDREIARRAAVRVFLAICAASAFLIQSSWPMTSFALTQLGIFAGLSATVPDPRVIAKGAMIAIPIAVALSGTTEFLVLDGADAFPLLALGMAPVVFGASLAILNPKWGGVGFFVLVYFPVLFPPSNPQSYNPLSYVLNSCLATVAIGLLVLLLQALIPTSDRDRRRWMVNAARRDLLRAIAGDRRLSAPEATYLTADRIVTLAGLEIGGAGGRKWRLVYTLLLSNLTNAAARCLEAIEALEDEKSCRAQTERARDALASLEPVSLRDAASALARSAFADQQETRRAIACAVAALQFSALLVDTNASTLRHLRQALAP